MTLQLRRDTAANWTSANPTLAAGQPGYETDTGRMKIGDGSTAWTSLAYRFETNTITFGTSPPGSPAVGDLWGDTT
jgi:hypothetical protein